VARALKWAAWLVGSVLACGLAILVVLLVAAAFDRGATNTDGASWIEAISTLAAVVIATIAALFAGRAFVLEDRRERRAQQDLQQFQAARVAVWAEVAKTRAQQGGRLRTYPGQLTIHLRNASDLPVTQVTVTLQLHGTKVDGNRWTTWGDDVEFPLLPPASTPRAEQVRLPQRFADEWADYVDDGGPEVTLAVSFRDSNNRWWVRYFDGTLEELDEPGHPWSNVP
jgi:hypothetical protein